ncbi:MAG: zinc-binding dehydrogenase [Oceanococcaceae bacterium]
MMPTSSTRLVSSVTEDGLLRLWLQTAPIKPLRPDEVLIQVQATPLNPSDQAVLFAFADLSTGRGSGSAEEPVFEADVPKPLLRMLSARIGKDLPVGNEGAGTVVAAGEQVQALLGKTVATMAGGMYAEYRHARASDCLPLPAGISAREAASSVVNPMTALSMLDVMRREGHRALVHTAAASNLGQMLNRICQEDGVGLVNIVRKPEQAELLRALGAEHVVDSSQPDFLPSLVAAVAATGATLAFDATGGGPLANQILTAMEAALSRDASQYSVYGSTTHKQVYLYGGLDRTPTQLNRGYGMAWGVGGFLLPTHLAKIGPAEVGKLFARVMAGLKTTFASHYAQEVDLRGMLQPEAIARYSKQATGDKFLVTPSLR